MKKDQLVSLLKVYTAYDKNAEALRFKRYGKEYDGGYVVPEQALIETDVLLGYGVRYDISFEEAFSQNFKKPSFGFDCGMESFKSQNPLFTFVNECIGTDKYLESNFKSTKKVTSFNEQLNNLDIKAKKLFIKMDIEGAEYEAFKDILPKYANNITGIALEIHLLDNISFDNAIQLLKDIDKDFVLVHVHQTNCADIFYSKNSVGGVTYALELSYINKSLLSHYEVAKNQSHPTEIDMPCNPGLKEYTFEVLVQ